MKTSTLLVGWLLALCSLASAAAGTLDQQYLPSQNGGLIIGGSQTVAQTFTVGLSGVLDRIDVEVARNSIPAPEGITLEIRSTLPNGSPTADVLASIFIPAADVSTSYQFMDFDLTPFALTVTGGDVLALVLRSDAGYQGQGGGIDPFAWLGDAPGGYTRGTVYFDNGTGFGLLSGWDMGFRSYVDTAAIPEPSALSLLVAGMGLLRFRRRIRISLEESAF